MELPELIAVLRRRWWLVVVVSVVVAGVLVWQARARPYQVSLRATVLIPGDTEIPGNSERPELMVMDDVPALVDSRAFAEGVHAAVPGTALTVDDVQASLDASRYSRVLTVLVTRENADEATEIAGAVAKTLPDLINRYLIQRRSAGDRQRDRSPERADAVASERRGEVRGPADGGGGGWGRDGNRC